MRKIMFLLLGIGLSVLCIGCEEEYSYISGPENSTTGNAPSSLSLKTLKLYKSDRTYWMGIYHGGQQKCTVSLYNGATVSSTYPPTYSYTRYGSSATYSLTFTTQTYIPYNGSYTYSQFKENITLHFISPTSGTYSGTQVNMNGGSKSISGNFIIE